MKWLLDAQLPKRLAKHLQNLGRDVVHTADLTEGNRTTDRTIAELANREDRIVISKDSDFVDWLLIHGKPRKLLHVTTGNISNDRLIRLFETHFETIESAFAESDLVELSQNGLVIHQ